MPRVAGSARVTCPWGGFSIPYTGRVLRISWFRRTVLIWLAAGLLTACAQAADHPARPTASSAPLGTPADLPNTYHAYLDCVSVNYPAAWQVEDAGGLGESYPASCPGWPQRGTTDVIPDCERDIESDGESGVVFVKGPGERIVRGPGTAPYASLKRLRQRCPTLERDLKRWGGYAINTMTERASISGQTAGCVESQHQWMDEPPTRGMTCLFVFDDVLYTFSVEALESSWADIRPKATAMRDSLRLKRFPTCGAPDFPAQHAHYCP